MAKLSSAMHDAVPDGRGSGQVAFSDEPSDADHRFPLIGHRCLLEGQRLAARFSCPEPALLRID